MTAIPRPEIAPSILSSDFARLGEQVTEVLDAGTRVIHVDVMDGHFVPPITIGPLIVDALRELVHARGAILDVHLMIERPERQVEAFAKAGADVITIHPESTPNIHYGLKLIRELGCKAGVVINPGTPVEAVEPVMEIVDLCLLMSVNPGWGGQKYIPSSTERLRRLRAMLPAEVVLEVDGGVSLATIDEVRAAGAELIVAGSAVFGADDAGDAYRALAARL
ncbi:MAG: ribulose-phosphate 3-epimerase [Actinobacteria bacterium]|nr:ribulose-phosphate 3-epimerase [Actinomycetota bacterium]MBV8394980.1 ribulose-phosphate 3-epimerase [Actinomycetota bacterium]MBV8599668.1 ribulose-phosphate 3-epimerase [Actinomycetota bacterium]